MATPAAAAPAAAAGDAARPRLHLSFGAVVSSTGCASFAFTTPSCVLRSEQGTARTSTQAAALHVLYATWRYPPAPRAPCPCSALRPRLQTEKNIEQLKLLNRAIFPINYTERMYKDILAYPDVTQAGHEQHQGMC